MRLSFPFLIEKEEKTVKKRESSMDSSECSRLLKVDAPFLVKVERGEISAEEILASSSKRKRVRVEVFSPGAIYEGKVLMCKRRQAT